MPNFVDSNVYIFLVLVFLYSLVVSIFRFNKYLKHREILYRVSYSKEFEKVENEFFYKLFCIVHISIYILWIILCMSQIIFPTINVLSELLAVVCVYIIFRSVYYLKFKILKLKKYL